MNVNHHRLLPKALVCATFASALVSLGAERHQPVDQLTRSADKVFVGTVGAKTSRWGADSLIYTDVVVSPDVTLKGAEEGAVVVQLLGGTIGDTTMTVSDGPQFVEGDRVIVFLKQENGRYGVVGRAEGAVSLSSPDANSVINETLTVLERGGRRIADRRSEISALTMRTTALQPRAQVGCYSYDGAKWGATSATYKIGTSVPSTWAASLDAAAATWSAAGAGFSLVNNASSANEISLADLVTKYGSSYSGTLALTTTWTSGARIVKATTEFNTKYVWNTTGASGGADVQNIATHELGHWLRLLDIYSPSTCSEVTMWGYGAYGETKKRTLEADDIAGFKALYSGATTTPTLTAPALASPSNGATGVSVNPSLVWGAVSGATSYDVYFSAASSTPVLVSSVASTSYTFPAALAASTAYAWKIVARNSSSSAASAVWTFTTGAATPVPTAVTLLTPVNGATGLGTSNTLSWKPVTGASYYDLYVGTTASPSRIGSIVGSTVSVTGFRAGTKYYWKVVAHSASGISTSEVWSFTTK